MGLNPNHLLIKKSFNWLLNEVQIHVSYRLQLVASLQIIIPALVCMNACTVHVGACVCACVNVSACVRVSAHVHTCVCVYWGNLSAVSLLLSLLHYQ